MNFIVLAGSELIDEIHKYESWEDEDTWTLTLHYIIMVCLIFAIIYWIKNVYNEIKELWRDRCSYFDDVWNYLDVPISVVSAIYMYRMSVDVIVGHTIYSETSVRTLGGVTISLLWIKMFYWMRLFSKTAYMIKLITTTIFDLKKFLYIVTIICAAFVSLFFTLSCNLTHEDRLERPYFDRHTGFRLPDVMISVYLISVGEFFTENFSEPPNSYILWPAFLACNFLISIVFMNMLIAIMG